MRNLNALIFLITLIMNLNIEAHDLNVFSGFINPESVAQDSQGNIYVSEIGEFNKDRDGKITLIAIDGTQSTFASGMDDPKGLAFVGKSLYVTDKNRILKVETNGKWAVYGGTMSYPQTPIFLNDITSDAKGNLYVSDSGNLEKGGALFKINRDQKVTLILNENSPEILAPNGVMILKNTLYEVDFSSGILYKINLKNKSIKKIAEGFSGGDGLIKSGDTFYISDWKNGKIFKVKNEKVTLFKEGFKSVADIALSSNGKSIIAPDMKAGTITVIAIH